MQIKVSWAVCLSILLCGTVGLAQQKEMPLQTPSTPEFRRIYLDVVATAKNGGPPVSGLTEQDFTVLDNKAPQTITSFRASGAGDPLEVILVIDAVDVPYSTVAYARDEIEKFFKANGGKLPYPMQLAIFTDTGTQVQNGFFTDGNALSTALDQYTVALRSIPQSSGFYGATERLQLAIKTLQELAAHGATLPGRKILLWVSPGWPILSGPGVQISEKQHEQIFDAIVNLSTSLRKARMTVYSVDPLGTADFGMRTFYYQNFVKGIRKPDNTELGDLSLQVIATQTGGLALHTSNDIAGLLKQAVSDADAYYEISFDPPEGEPNEYHQIEVKIGKPGLIARTRSGYYSSR